MAAVMALISKGVFQKEHPGREPGQTLPITHYASTHRALAPLQDGGDLYLVTVRPDDALWLLGVLKSPSFNGDGYSAAPNTTPIADVSPLKPVLQFSTGKGMSQEPGRLGMSLQTPRTLTDEDVVHLDTVLQRASASSTPSPPSGELGEGTAPPLADAAGHVTEDADTASDSTRGNPTTSDGEAASPGFSRPLRPKGVPPQAWFDESAQTWTVGTTDEDGLVQGWWKWWRPDGSFRKEMRYRNGLAVDVSRGFHPDGSLAERIHWHDGYQGDSEFLREPEGVETDFTLIHAFAPNVVRSVLTVDDRWTISASQTFDADGNEVLPSGEPFPFRPDGVPSQALFVPPREDMPEGRFISGRFETGTDRSIGSHRIWSVDGDFLGEHFFDALGFRLWSHQAGEEHPVDIALGAFFGLDRTKAERKERFSVAYALAKVWTPELHEHVVGGDVVLETEALFDYVDGTLSHLSYHDPWGAVPSDFYALDALSRSRQLDSDASTTAANLRQRRATLGSIGTEQRHFRQIRDDVSIDHTGRVWLGEGDGEPTQTPVQLCNSRFGFARRLRAYDRCDDRRVYLSGKHVFWVLQRYQTTLLLMGSEFFPSRDQAELTLQCLVHCPDMAWTNKMQTIFEDMLPSRAKRPHQTPFLDAKEGHALFRLYDGTPSKNGGSCSLGVFDCKLLNGSGAPSVMASWMLEGKSDGPSVISEHPTDADAVDAFASQELQLLHAGYSLERIVRMPLATPAPKSPPKKRKRPSRRPVDIDVDENADVTPHLQAATVALEAEDTDGAITALLEGWREKPAAAIADAMDAVSSLYVPPEPISGRGKAPVAAYESIRALHRTSCVPALLAALPSVKIQDAVARYDIDVGTNADPRIDAAHLRWCLDIPFSSTSSKKFWTRVFRRLESTLDSRQRGPLAGLAAHYAKAWDTTAGAWAADKAATVADMVGPRLEALSNLGLGPAEADALATFLNALGRQQQR